MAIRSSLHQLPFPDGFGSLASVDANHERVFAMTARVLLLHDHHTAEPYLDALRTLPIELIRTRVPELLSVARMLHFDLLLIDLRTSDPSVLAVICMLRSHGITTPFVVIATQVSVPVAVEFTKLGALAIIEAPVDHEALTQVVGSAIRPIAAMSPPTNQLPVSAPERVETGISPSRSTAERWAAFVLRAAQSDHDPKTLAIWARLVNVSRAVLCEYCRLVHVLPHAARDFARILRVILRSNGRWEPEAMLDVADTRTLKRLLNSAGISTSTRVPTLDDFFENQRWIPRDNPGLVVLYRLLPTPRP